MKFSMDPVWNCRGRFIICQSNILERASPALLAFCVSVLFSLAMADEISASDAIADDALFFDSIPSVFGASKYEQKVTDAPATVSVITADEIARYGYRNLAEILASLPGMYMTNDRNYGYLGVRGLSLPGDYNSRILILIDGQRYDDPIYLATGILQDFPMDVDLIERLELIRGPGSALYGSAAMLGVVNIITKRGRDISGVEFNAQYGSFDTYKIRASYGARLDNGLEVMLSATKYESDGQKKLYYPEYDDPETNNGIYVNNDHDSHESVKAALGYKDFSFNAAWAKRKKGIPTASYETLFNDNRAYTNDDYLVMAMAYSSVWADRFDVSAHVGYVSYQYDGDYPYDWPPVIINRDESDGRAFDAEFHAGFDLGERNRLLLGIEGRYSHRQDQSNFDILEDGHSFNLDEKRDSTNWGVFIQDDLTLTPKINVVLGLRYDHYDNFGGNTSPRLAMVYKLTDTSTLKALYGQAFRAPNGYELYYNDDGFTSKPPENLQPEETEYFELVLEHSFNQSLRATISLYKYHLHFVLVTVTDPEDDLLQYQNGPTVDVSGLEVVLEGDGPWGTEGRISYSHNDGHDETDGEKLPNSPRHMAKLNLGFPILDDKLSAGFELQYSSRRKLLEEGWSRSYLVANLGLQTRTFSNGIWVGLYLYNLFDEVIEHVPGEEFEQRVIEQDGRSLMFRLTGTF
ncbi:MAG: TonB-dependent receptor [Xanthomonadales bacterium]|nr:TonB-dependent receptor [Xanthomonadales bacterium]